MDARTKRKLEYVASLNKMLQEISVSPIELNNYINSNTKISIVGVCGHKIERTPDKIKRTINLTGTLKCDACGRRSMGDNKVSIKKTRIPDEISRYGGVLLSDYVGANIPLKLIGQCGHPLERRIGYIRKEFELSGKLLCRECGYSEAGKKARQDPGKYEEFFSIRGAKLIVSSVKKSNGPADIIGSCGHYFTTKNLYHLKYVTTDRAKVLCPNCFSKARSKGEEEVSEFIKKLGVIVVDGYVPGGDRKLEADIFVPSLNIAFEYNGLNWHSERILSAKYEKPKRYHIEKTEYFMKKGITLIHINENEWLFKRDIVESIVSAKLNKSKDRIFARKCKARIITNSEAKAFLESNHRQGSCKSSLSVGLLYGGDLVAVMSISKSRFSKKYDTELLRFAGKINSSIIGGFSKLLKFASKTMELGRMVTYSDIRYSSLDPQNTVYAKAGFKFSHTSTPNYFYFKRGKYNLMSRVQFQKHKLKDKLDIFDPSKTEYENMVDNRYDRIWDCGNHVFVRDFS